MKPIRARFAPSPTGRLHIGGARTALYDYLLARQTGGQFILRIEDTDQKRYVPGAEKELMDGLRWIGLEWDEGPDIGGPYGPYRQLERKGIHSQVANGLIDNGYAFRCFCSAERLAHVREEKQKRKESIRYDGTCRNLSAKESAERAANGEPFVIRFKMPKEGSITMHDTLRGDITVLNQNLDDSILVKSDGLALYHLAALVDDHFMEITHVLRSSEWLPTFPLHAHLYRALGWEEPVWVHLSVFLKPSGKGKMGKRDTAQMLQDGFSIFVTDMGDMGFLPEAVVNWISLMGWGYSGAAGESVNEFFTLSDLVERFSFDHLNPSPAAINIGKLDHFNGMHVRNLSIQDFTERLIPFYERAGIDIIASGRRNLIEKIAPIIQIRTTTLDEAPELTRFFFLEDVQPTPQDLIGKKMSAVESAKAAQSAYDFLSSLAEITPETAEHPMRELAESLGLSAGQFFGILRMAVTAQEVSPPLFESMAIIGKEKTLQRIMNAIKTLESMG
ncbi:MAG: glutamate--tRNA ligase [Chloroflexota bacterium]